MKKNTLLLILVLTAQQFFAQFNEQDSCDIKNSLLDSIFISETEDVKGKDKVLHAEPLFIDLIRDLGARKGEHEWNVGLGMTDQKNFDNYTTLVEYEWAPIDNLGLEVELPFSFYFPIDSSLKRNDLPENKLNSFKMAAQYSFFVSERYKTSMAIGYIHEVELTSFKKYRKEKLFEGSIYSPFFVAAKRWGDNFHTLLYTGPLITQHRHGAASTVWQINSNVHYMISGTRNFIGVEFNKSIAPSDFDMTIRPQMRVGVTDNLLVGIVTGIPIKRENQRFSTFLRLIYEPKHKVRHA